MRKSLFITLVISVSALLVSLAFAGSRPDYDCARRARECEKGCDQRAETGKNANAYHRCLKRCREGARRCEERQRDTNICADAFQRCIRNAGSSQSAREGCRQSYRECKGHR